MCNSACIEFIGKNLSRTEIEGKSVLEVGSLDVNGSPRAAVMELSPSRYTGVDLSEGPGVDLVCDATGITRRFGPGSFDVVISTEMIEHARDWRTVISNLKDVLKPGGLLLLTTRSIGYPYHAYPHDYWRYEEEDLRAILSDMDVMAVSRDQLVPGVFAKARKPDGYSPKDLSSFALYSIIAGERRASISGAEIAAFRLQRTLLGALSALLPAPVKRFIKTLAGRGGQAGEK